MHSLVPAPHFVPRPEVEALERALSDRSARVVWVVGERGCGKTALVQHVLRETRDPILVWRYDLEPDPRALLEVLAAAHGEAPDLEAVAGARGPRIAVVDGVDPRSTRIEEDLPRGHALRDLVDAVMRGEGGLRLVVVVTGAAAEIAHDSASSRVVEVAPARRSFAEVAATPQWYGRDRETLRMHVERESELARGLLSLLAELGGPVPASAVASMMERLEDAHPEQVGAELAGLAERSLARCVPTDAGLAYTVDPHMAAVAALPDPGGWLDLQMLYSGLVFGPDVAWPEALEARADCIEDQARQGDVMAALSGYVSLFEHSRSKCVPSVVQADVADRIIRRCGIRAWHAFIGRYPWLDRAVSRLLRGEPARAVSDLRALQQAPLPRDPQLDAAIAEALVEAWTALGQLSTAETVASEALQRSEGAPGLLARRGRTRAFLGDVDAAQSDLREAAKGWGARISARIAWAELLLRQGRLRGARRVLGARPNADGLGARWGLVAADLARLEGDLEGAARAIEQVLRFAEAEQSTLLWLAAGVVQSRVLRRLGDTGGARAAARRTVEEANRVGYALIGVDAQLALARADPAAVDPNACIRAARDCGYARAVGDGLQLAAERAFEAGDDGRARALGEEALAVRRRLRDPRLANTLDLLRR